MTAPLLALMRDPAVPNTAIADEYGVAVRTVIRWRGVHGIPSSYTVPEAEHGTPARYSAGCHCTACRGAHAARVRDEYAAIQSITTASATRRGEPWAPWEDAHLLEVGPLRAALDLSRTYAGCIQRARPRTP